MRNTFKFLLASLFLVSLWSCEDEQNLLILTPPASFEIITPEAGTSVTLTPDLATNPALTVSWQAAEYGVQTSITYIIEIAQTGTNFENLIEAGSTSNTNITWSVLELNGAAVGAGLTPFEQGGLDIRIKATTGTAGSQAVYSNVVTVLITTFSTDLPLLWIPGSYQVESGYGSNNWSHATAPTLAASAFGSSDFEGYVFFANDVIADDDNGFIFSSQQNWDGTNYGDDGTFSGILSDSGSNIGTSAGYYRVRANTASLTYGLDPTVWGIVGAATPGGWDNSTPLTYNPTTKLWEGVVVMTAGDFKFRANNAWDINLGGPADSMTYGGPDLSLDAGGTYFVELDLTTPRQYTYTLTAQ